jgi:predicted enzyme related to lactoylglutathione lyase
MLGQIIIDCDDLEAAVHFWSGALGTTIEHRSPPYVFLQTAPEALRIGLQAVPEPKRVKNRMHLDILTDDLEAEVRRLEALGAARQQQVETWWIMTDPCGNEFCVITTRPDNFDEQARAWPD